MQKKPIQFNATHSTLQWLNLLLEIVTWFYLIGCFTDKTLRMEENATWLIKSSSKWCSKWNSISKVLIGTPIYKGLVKWMLIIPIVSAFLSNEQRDKLARLWNHLAQFKYAQWHKFFANECLTFCQILTKPSKDFFNLLKWQNFAVWSHWPLLHWLALEQSSF